MLSEFGLPEKSVTVHDCQQLQEVLETSFKSTYRRTTLERIHLRPDAMIECEGECFACEQLFLEALAQSIGMSLSYAYSIPFDLFCHNFRETKKHNCKAVTICLSRDLAVNLAPGEYRPARTADVLRELEHATFWKLREARVSDRGVEINLTEPGCTAVVEVGDEIELGIRISNSETGHGGLKASLFSLRLVCTNGAIMADKLGTARWNYDPRVAYSTSIEKFAKEVPKLRTRQELQARLYGPGLHRFLLDNEMSNLWRRLRVLLPANVIDSILGLESEERQALQLAVRQRPVGIPAASTSHSLWEIHNRITAAAQRLDFEKRSRLERIGGAMLLRGSQN